MRSEEISWDRFCSDMGGGNLQIMILLHLVHIMHAFFFFSLFLATKEKSKSHVRIHPLLPVLHLLHLQKTWDDVEGIRESHIQSLSHVWLFATPWTAARQAALSFTISWNLLKVISVESVRLSNHLLFCLLLLLSSIFPSIRVFSSESALHIKWSKYWNFSCSVSPSMNIQD